ncbi:MAG: DNA primase [Bacteroidetes bacterium]|jgi:DNA primase|nr:DNA primase [Bacteroidota bacterium]
MIPKETVELILETARIEEVVGEFVSLKKRGANLLGLCPFHSEKTPSFTVSPAKGIYKCFGCGKAGDSVRFIMEHESFSYPEALKYLAEKYRIEIEEEKPTPEQIQKQDEKESLFVLYSFAQRFFSDNLFTTEEGQAVGLSYFNERGFNESIIKKFQLGYAPQSWDALTQAVYANSFNKQIYEKSGLAIVKEAQGEESAPHVYDRFRARVIFPIHNLTGRVIAFGARQLNSDPKSPKYINSPETDIYYKSKSLYGIYFARKAIIQNDECYLVEGYTDVISLHQAGVENVVASSGTSLTHDQIRLIARFTKNITILYDGDTAGIKASLRGIDLILEEGLNVRIVLFPEGDDPDSFARKTGTLQLKEYIKNNARDFIAFKTGLLLKEVANDPIRKAGLIKDIVESISKIPDGILRSMYVKQCAEQMEVTEQVLMFELNKLRRNQYQKSHDEESGELAAKLLEMQHVPEQPESSEMNAWHQEKEIIRLLLNYGDRVLHLPGEDQESLTIREFIYNELAPDGYGFDDEIFAGIYSHFVTQSAAEFVNMLKADTSAELEKLRGIAMEMLINKYELNDWESKGIHVRTEEGNMNEAVINPIYHLKLRRAVMLRQKNSQRLKDSSSLTDEELEDILTIQKGYTAFIFNISKFLGIVTLK